MQFVKTMLAGSFSLPCSAISIVETPVQGRIEVVNYNIGAVTSLDLNVTLPPAIVSETVLTHSMAAIGSEIYGEIYVDVTFSSGTYSSSSVTSYTSAGGEAVESIIADVGGTTYAYIAAHEGASVASFIVENDETLTFIEEVIDTDSIYGIGTSSMATLVVSGTTYLFQGASIEHGITAYRINNDGTLMAVDSVGIDNQFPVQELSALASVTIHDQGYVIAAASGSSSLTVFGIADDGTMTVTDHIIDSLSTRLQLVTEIEVVEHNGHAYVVAAGADDGISLFSLLATGQLLLLESYTDTPHTSMQDISSLEAVVVDEQIQIVVTSGVESGLSIFSHDISAVGNSEVGTDADLLGSAEDDLLQQTSSASIHGGSGDDILVDGLDSNTLSGGAGGDLFVLMFDGQTDTISDFELMIDRIDLSFWAQLYHLNQLEFQTTPQGGVISFNDEELIILSSDETSLSFADLEESILIPVVHVDADRSVSDIEEASSGDDEILGTSAADLLMGYGGDDRLLGYYGSDRLNGGSGGDALIGGSGSDTADYTGYTGTIRVGAHVLDLQYSTLNTGDGAGDTYDSIENITGSESRELLRGDTGDNILDGAGNVDFIAGRQGDDTLYGGQANDVLVGGAGADHLDGGADMDQARYSYSLTAVIIDMEDVSLNTGEAAGDTYVSIENIAGSTFSDLLYGDGQDNLLIGDGNHDELYGRDGDDTLNGGGGVDYLEGGAGDDTLWGGYAPDTFAFTEGHDTIEDYFDFGFRDRIVIDQSLTGGLQTAADVVSTYATVVGDDILFDFGDGDSLLVTDFTDLTTITDDISIV